MPGMPLRSDLVLRELYDALRTSGGFEKFVARCPCAATKMFLLTRDEVLGTAIFERYYGNNSMLPVCPRRGGEPVALQALPLGLVSSSVRELLLQQKNREMHGPVMYGINAREDVLGRENPLLDPLTMQAGYGTACGIDGSNSADALCIRAAP